MPQVKITGNTFNYRDVLKTMGAEWDNKQRVWTGNLTDTQIATVRKMVGCTVSEYVRPVPVDTDDAGFSAPIAARKVNHRKSAIYGNDPTYHNHFVQQNVRAFLGFDSLEAFTDYIDAIPPHARSSGRAAGWLVDDQHDTFTGTHDMSEALDLARHGWQEGIDKASEYLDRLELAMPEIKRRKRAVAGGVVNVGRMLSGMPDHMVTRTKQPGQKVVTFFVEAGCNASIKAETLIVRAAMIAMMIDVMEHSGYSCDIVIIDTSIWHEYPIYQLAVKIKSAGEHLNLSDIIFALGHPSFLRRLSFAACTSVMETQEIWVGQGNEDDAFDRDHPLGKTEFYIPVLRINLIDPLRMLRLITPDNLPIKIID